MCLPLQMPFSVCQMQAERQKSLATYWLTMVAPDYLCVSLCMANEESMATKVKAWGRG